MPPNPPNLLPSAKTHDFKVQQVFDRAEWLSYHFCACDCYGATWISGRDALKKVLCLAAGLSSSNFSSIATAGAPSVGSVCASVESQRVGKFCTWPLISFVRSVPFRADSSMHIAGAVYPAASTAKIDPYLPSALPAAFAHREHDAKARFATV